MAHSVRDLTCYWCGKVFSISFASTFCGKCKNPDFRSKNWELHRNYIAGLRTQLEILVEDNSKIRGEGQNCSICGTKPHQPFCTSVVVLS